jgi:hypothetical protein
VRRICVRYSDPHGYGLVQEIDWRRCVNIVVLELSIGTDDILDLSALKCLRSLKLRASGGRLRGLGKMVDLAWLELLGIDCAECSEEIGNLRKLQVLRLRTSCPLTNPPTEGQVSEYKCKRSQRLNLGKVKNCIYLKELVLECGCLKVFPDLGGMTSLRKVVFKGCGSPTEVMRLGSHMCELRLIKCYSVLQFLDFKNVDSLQVLVVDRSASNVEVFPELSKLRKLRKLTIRDTPDLLRLPELAGLTALEDLRLDGLLKVRGLPDMNQLRKLRIMRLWHFPRLLQLPQLDTTDSAAEALRRLDLRYLPNVQTFPDLRLLRKLESIELIHTPLLMEQPSLVQKVSYALKYFFPSSWSGDCGHEKGSLDCWCGKLQSSHGASGTWLNIGVSKYRVVPRNEWLVGVELPQSNSDISS